MEPWLARVFIFPFIKKQLIIPVKELLMSLFTLAEKWLQDTPQRTYSECIHKPARALGTTSNLQRGSALGFLPFRLFASLFFLPLQFSSTDLGGNWQICSTQAGMCVLVLPLAQAAQYRCKTVSLVADKEQGKRRCSVSSSPTKPRSAAQLIRRWRWPQLPLHPVL